MSRNGCLIAAIQMTSSHLLPDNLKVASMLIADVAAQGAQLVVLPEYFCLMGQQDADKLAIQEPLGNGSIQDFLANTAKQHNIYLVAAGIPIQSKEPNKTYNTFLLYNPAGQLIYHYHKIHLFGFQNQHEYYQESNTIACGTDVASIDTPIGKIAAGICYDLRFPEIFRCQAPFDMLILPAAFTYTTGSAHWEVLLRARAIENQCYVIAAAQGGRHTNGRQTYGHACIIDPWGNILSEVAEGQGFAIAELDHTFIQKVRTQLPALQHRKIF